MSDGICLQAILFHSSCNNVLRVAICCQNQLHSDLTANMVYLSAMLFILFTGLCTAACVPPPGTMIVYNIKTTMLCLHIRISTRRVTSESIYAKNEML